jgi:hypothetical protein
VEFNDNAYFRFAKFNRSALFKSSKFNRISTFVQTTFYSDADFSGANFGRAAEFYQSDFANSATIANFDSANFNDIADFSYSNFNSQYVSFSNSNFIRNANFLNISINRRGYFSNSNFNGNADFRKSKLNNNYFINSYFKNTADFSDSEFIQVASFNRSRFMNDVLFEGADLNCTLYLNRTKYDKLVIRWRAIRNLAYDDSNYLSLIDNFKKLGYFDDAIDCYYKYSNLKTNQESGWSKLKDYIIWASCGYGVKPFHPIYSGVFILILFGVFYFLGSMHGFWNNFKNLNIPRDSPKGQNKRKMIESLIFSVIALLSLPKDFYPYGPAKYDNLLGRNIKIYNYNLQLIRILAVIERLIGWSLLLLFINTLSRVMIHI